MLEPQKEHPTGEFIKQCYPVLPLTCGMQEVSFNSLETVVLG